MQGIRQCSERRATPPGSGPTVLFTAQTTLATHAPAPSISRWDETASRHGICCFCPLGSLLRQDAAPATVPAAQGTAKTMAELRRQVEAAPFGPDSFNAESNQSKQMTPLGLLITQLRWVHLASDGAWAIDGLRGAPRSCPHGTAVHRLCRNGVSMSL